MESCKARLVSDERDQKSTTGVPSRQPGSALAPTSKSTARLASYQM